VSLKFTLPQKSSLMTMKVIDRAPAKQYKGKGTLYLSYYKGVTSPYLIVVFDGVVLWGLQRRRHHHR
jgi:hypothetical protein